MAACLVFVVPPIECFAASNYDDYLTLLALRNEESQRVFREHHPSGDFVLDYVLGSPEFRETHPILRDYDRSEEYDGECWTIKQPLHGFL